MARSSSLNRKILVFEWQDSHLWVGKFSFLNGDESSVTSYTGNINLINGEAQNTNDFTLLNARSFAENIIYSNEQGTITGSVVVTDGALDNTSIVVTGDSLLHSVPLTTQAFTRGFFGDYGQYIVSLGLMLFFFLNRLSCSPEILIRQFDRLGVFF